VTITAKPGVKLEIPDGAVLENKVWASSHRPEMRQLRSVLSRGVTLTHVFSSTPGRQGAPGSLSDAYRRHQFFRGPFAGAAALVNPLSFVYCKCHVHYRCEGLVSPLQNNCNPLWCFCTCVFGAPGTNILLK